MRTIAGKLVLSVVIILLIVCLALGATTYFNASTTLLQEAEYALFHKANDNAKLIGERLDTRLKILETVAANEEVSSMDWQRQKPTLEIEKERLDYLAFAVITPDGTAKYLDESVLQLGDRDYVQKAFAGESNVSDIIMSRATNEPVLMLSTPIKQNNQVVGVLIARIDGYYLSEITDDIRFGETGYTFMINQTGTFVAHQDRELVKNQVNYIENESQNTNESKKNGTISIGPFITEIIEKEEGVGHFQFSGQHHSMGYAPIKGTNWYIAVGALEDELLKGLNDGRTYILLSSLFTCILGISLAFFVGKSFSRPIVSSMQIVEKMAEGDFRQQLSEELLKRKDEIGDLARGLDHISLNMKQMLSQLTSNAHEVADSAVQLNTSAKQSAEAHNQVALTMEEVANAADQQQRTAEESANSMEEMSIGIERAAHTAVTVADAAHVMSDKAGQGQQAMLTVVEQFQQIQESTDQTMSVINSLQQDSQEVGQIIQMISEISEQTNLLALNAAIEAARAGEAGRGFSVVAQEVRKLADQTRFSAQKINELIMEMQKNTKQAVQSMNNGSREVQKGRELVHHVGGSFQEILSSIKHVSREIEELSAVTEEMSAGALEVNASVQGMVNMAKATASHTQNVAASSEEQLAVVDEINASATKLAEMSVELQQLVQKFKV